MKTINQIAEEYLDQHFPQGHPLAAYREHMLICIVWAYNYVQMDESGRTTIIDACNKCFGHTFEKDTYDGGKLRDAMTACYNLWQNQNK